MLFVLRTQKSRQKRKKVEKCGKKCGKKGGITVYSGAGLAAVLKPVLLTLVKHKICKKWASFCLL